MSSILAYFSRNQYEINEVLKCPAIKNKDLNLKQLKYLEFVVAYI